MLFSLKEIHHFIPEVEIKEDIEAMDYFDKTTKRTLSKGTNIWIKDIEEDNYVVTIKYGSYKLLIPSPIIDSMISDSTKNKYKY